MKQKAMALSERSESHIRQAQCDPERKSNGSKGFAHILMIVVLVLGLAAAIYMVQQKTNIFPKAYVSVPINWPTGVPESPNGKPPAKPVKLSGYCMQDYNRTGTTGTDAGFVWSAGDSNPTLYFVRYKDANGFWWPSKEEAGLGGTMAYFFKPSSRPGEVFSSWGVYACNLAGCSDFVRGPEFKCPELPAPTLTPVEGNISAIPSCTSSGPNPSNDPNYMEVKISGTVPQPTAPDGIWIAVQDMKTNQSAYNWYGYGSPYDNGLYMIFGGVVPSVGGLPLPLYPDGRTYAVTVFQAPYSSVAAPVSSKLLAVTTFSKTCSVNIPMPTPYYPWVSQITPPPVPAD